MRRAILCLLWLHLTFSLFAQQTIPAAPTPAAAPLTKEDYQRKSAGQAVGAALLAAAGTGFVLGAVSYDMNHLFDASASNTTGYYVAGLGCLGGSIALFVSSLHNKRRARLAPVAPSVRMDKALVPARGGLKDQGYPALALTVKL